MRDSSAFKGLVAGVDLPISLLSEDEVKMMLEKDYVDWEKEHTDILQSISVNHTLNRTNAAAYCVTHVDQREQQFHFLAHQCLVFLDDPSNAKKEVWRCGINTLAANFVRIMENEICKGRGSHKNY